MLKDLLDSVAFYYGNDALVRVSERMKLMNRARENNAEIDAVEKLLAETH